MGSGGGARLATRPALKALGFEASDTSTRALARLAGSRDIALGLLTIAVRDDRVALREATAAAAAVDLGHAVCFAIAGRRPPAAWRRPAPRSKGSSPAAPLPPAAPGQSAASPNPLPLVTHRVTKGRGLLRQLRSSSSWAASAARSRSTRNRSIAS